MKIYNEIYPAEGWADKISKYLKKVAEEKPNMYAKTRRRYENLARSLLSSASLIFSILDSSNLTSRNEDEFDELSSPLSSLAGQLEDLNYRLGKMNNSALPAVDDEDARPRVFESVNYFDRIFKEATAINFGFSEVNDCARCLYKWFHTRFRPEIRDPDFRFQAQQIPVWVSNFIILYGKYHHAGKASDFSKMLDNWCTRIATGQNSKYAVPAEIYLLEKERNPSDYTIDAVVINDLLSNGYLYKLFSDETPGSIHCDPNTVVAVVKDRNPSLSSKIATRIAKRNELISEIGLTPVGGMDVDE